MENNSNNIIKSNITDKKEENQKSEIVSGKDNVSITEKDRLLIEQERMKNLFPEKKKKINEIQVGWRGQLEKIKSNDLLDKIVWTAVALFAMVGVGLYIKSKELTKELNNEKVAIARYIGDFIITEQLGPKPFIVSLKDVKSNEEYKNIKISNDCKLFDKKSYVGEHMQLIKFTIVNVNDENDKSYFFKGVEERICEGRSFVPDSSNAFYIQ